VARESLATGKSAASEIPGKLVVAGKITTVHGVKGWVKIHSYTAPESNLFDYQPWYMKFTDGWKRLEIDQYRSVAKGFIAHIRGLDDREEARLYCQRDIQVSPDLFPVSGGEDIYWHQLQGVKVISVFDGRESILGVVDGYLETGANDVAIVKATSDSIDSIERLIPYIDSVFLEIDLENARLVVDWDPDFESRKE